MGDVIRQSHLSPAKINLMLRILGRRADGYHELQTLFLLLNWGDRITPSRGLGQSCGIEISGIQGVATADNLMFKASRLLLPHVTQASDWQFQVDKVIPQGGGLGGGSSNAAFALRFLNTVWGCGLSQAELMQLGLELGADVPVFIQGQSALAAGVGENLSPMHFDVKHVLLLFPECQINTHELFAHPDLHRSQVDLSKKRLNDTTFWINDFLPLLLKINPTMARLYDRLQNRIPVRLSGSGSTLFALYDHAEMAEQAARWASQYCRTAVVQALADDPWPEYRAR